MLVAASVSVHEARSDLLSGASYRDAADLGSTGYPKPAFSNAGISLGS